MTQVYISIGSNINSEENITLVKSKLEKLFTCSFSDVFNSKAIGFKGKDFLNLVVGFTYKSDLYSLNTILKNIEIEMGRDQDQKGMSDRIIDLDADLDLYLGSPALTFDGQYLWASSYYTPYALFQIDIGNN